MNQTQEAVQTKPPTFHSRTYEYVDPVTAIPEDIAERTGADLIQGMADGAIPPPPIASLIDFNAFEIIDGQVRLSFVPQTMHYNYIGTVHGGVIATMLDTAAACALHYTLPPGVGYTSQDLSTKFLRPVTSNTGEVFAEGRLIHRGSRTALAEANLTDADGRLLAHATSSLLIFAD